MSVKDPKSNNKKSNESQNETGKVLSFPNKKNFGPQDPSKNGGESGGVDKAPLRLVPVEKQEPVSEPGMSGSASDMNMSSKWSRSTTMKVGMMFAFFLGVVVTSQMTKFMGGDGGRQIASDENSSQRTKEAEKALLEKIEQNREPNAVWSLNSIPTEEKFLHGYLLGNYQTTYEMSTGLLLSVEYTPSTLESRRTPREFSELDREEFFKTYASLWVQGYSGYEKIGSHQASGFVEETYKLKGIDSNVTLMFKVDSKNHLIAIKRAE